jgi:hypothetical protein
MIAVKRLSKLSSIHRRHDSVVARLGDVARARARAAIGATGRHRSQQSDPPRPSPTGITGAPKSIVASLASSFRLAIADFAINGFQDPLAAISDRRLSAFEIESSRHCPWQVPVCPERIFRLASS